MSFRTVERRKEAEHSVLLLVLVSDEGRVNFFSLQMMWYRVYDFG